MTYNFNWTLVLGYLPEFLEGLMVGLALAGISLVLGSLLATGMALASIHGPWWVRVLVKSGVELIRNVPILLWVYFLFYGLPLAGVRGLDNFGSFIVTLTLYAAAYLTEVFRAGFLAVPARYGEAAKALGLRRLQRFRLVTAPLTLRVVLPPYGSTLVSLFKDTSVAAAIGVAELTFVAQRVNQLTFRVIEVWTITSILYLAVGYVMILGFRQLEHRVRMAV